MAVPGVRADFYVATNGDDANPGTQAKPWRTIQQAANNATPGVTIFISAGLYHEKITLNVSGTAANYITFQAVGAATISGAGVPGANLIYGNNISWLKLIGFELRDNLNVNDGSGIRLEGGGDHVEIRNNSIHNIRGVSAMGITIYGDSATSPISNLIIDGNEIYDCEPAQSEALVLNGNITNFQVTSNSVHDVNNIGIDFIGGEATCPDPAQDAARNGVCRGNRVFRARSNYGGGFGAGIYVDGGHDIVVEHNQVYECDLGLEVGAENLGILASNVVVRENLLFHNDKAGLVFGGYSGANGLVVNCQFLNNTCFKNDQTNGANGELWTTHGSNNVVRNNLFYGGAQNRLLTADPGGFNNLLDYNVWFAEAGSNTATFAWQGFTHTGFTAYRAASAQDTHSLFVDPLLVDSAQTNLHLTYVSPAVNAGDPAFVVGNGETDFDGLARVIGGRVDVGAFEVVPPLAPQFSMMKFIGNGQIQLTLTGETNRVYAVQYATNFSNWISFNTNAPMSGTATVTDAAVNFPRRFYRAVVLP